MKTLDLKTLDVQELNTDEMKTKNGGFDPLTAFGTFIGFLGLGCVLLN